MRISRRSLLAGAMSVIALPKLPMPPQGVAYIVYEAIPLERFAMMEVRDRRVIDDPWVRVDGQWRLLL